MTRLQLVRPHGCSNGHGNEFLRYLNRALYLAGGFLPLAKSTKLSRQTLYNLWNGKPTTQTTLCKVRAFVEREDMRRGSKRKRSRGGHADDC